MENNLTRRKLKGNVLVKCSFCSNNFKCWRYELKRYKNFFCSSTCKSNWISLNNRGKNNPLYKIPRSEEVKNKLKLANIGKTTKRRGLSLVEEYGVERAKEIKEKLRVSHLTQKPSELCIKNLKEYFKNKPKIVSKKTSHISSKFKKGNIPWSKGLTKDNTPSLCRISQAMKIRRKTQKFPLKDTSIEEKIRNFLDLLKIEYFQHKYININHGYQCDFFIPSINMVIEADGNYWHKYPIGREIDHIRTKELLEKGFKVLRLWEFEIRKMDINGFKEKLKDGGG